MTPESHIAVFTEGFDQPAGVVDGTGVAVE